jgi:hypothetical protein
MACFDLLALLWGSDEASRPRLSTNETVRPQNAHDLLAGGVGDAAECAGLRWDAVDLLTARREADLVGCSREPITSRNRRV